MRHARCEDRDVGLPSAAKAHTQGCADAMGRQGRQLVVFGGEQRVTAAPEAADQAPAAAGEKLEEGCANHMHAHTVQTLARLIRLGMVAQARHCAAPAATWLQRSGCSMHGWLRPGIYLAQVCSRGRGAGL